MATFLTTAATVFNIEKIIIEAKKSITLVTPYLKLSNNMIERFQDAEKKNIEITIIYGKTDIQACQMDILQGLKNVEIYFYLNLHAKCYHNEKLMIISSMNLHEYSERNNREMGILLEIDHDSEIYEDALKEIQSIKNASKHSKTVVYTKREVEPVCEINPNYKETWNFHLPKVYEILRSEYPTENITFNKGIVMNDFPQKGITIEIDNRIDFRFENETKFKSQRSGSKERLKELFPRAKFYWNYNVINVYPPENTDGELNLVNLKVKSSLYYSMIKSISESLLN